MLQESKHKLSATVFHFNFPLIPSYSLYNLLCFSFGTVCFSLLYFFLISFLWFC